MASFTDAVSKHLPKLGTPSVAVPQYEGSGKVTYALVPAEREMTIQDLLRHTSGIGYGQNTPSARLKEAYAKEGVDWRDVTPAEQMERLAKVPLAHQPGTVWEYSLSTDMLGRVVEAVSGKTLGARPRVDPSAAGSTCGAADPPGRGVDPRRDAGPFQARIDPVVPQAHSGRGSIPSCRRFIPGADRSRRAAGPFQARIDPVAPQAHASGRGSIPS